MAGSSTLSPLDASAQMQHLEFLYASTANVSNFVSVKLSGDCNYDHWAKQMLCLMETYSMQDIVEATDTGPKKRHDSLVKGWIFGSISEGLLGTVLHLSSAKDVWDKLKSFYGPAMTSSKQDIAQAELEAKGESEDKDEVSTETNTFSIEIETEEKYVLLVETRTQDIDMVSTETDIDVYSTETEKEGKIMGRVETKEKGKETIPTEKQENEKTKINAKSKMERNKELRKAIVEGTWWDVHSILTNDKDAIMEPINSDGNTVLHIAVGISRNIFVKDILVLIEGEVLTEMINLDGSTALHIAAIVGNTDAAELLIMKNRSLLEMPDHKGQTPLAKAYKFMHVDTIECLLKAASESTGGKKRRPSISVRKSKKNFYPSKVSSSPSVKIGVDLLVNAISAKQYDLATNLVKKFPEFALENDKVLMAIARTFPRGLYYGETLIYPVIDGICERIVKRARDSFKILVDFYKVIMGLIGSIPEYMILNIIGLLLCLILLGPLMMLALIYLFVRLLILLVYFPIVMSYFLLWKVATRVVPPIKHIEKTKKEWEEAKKVLKLVCKEIDKLDSPDAHPRYYTEPILEAARQNAYEVVEEILSRFPEAIQYKDKSGYDIIQLAVMHRSEKIYNLIYIIGERKSVYRTMVDSSMNNMLHLAGRLAPSHKLKCIRGAALQLQRELQWRQEVEKLVFPTYTTKENIFMETPDMVFTKEHENLVKEGEKWMKAVAESCSITAALITTIVFAAAITVPGGSNQETGIPLFTKDIAFTIFALSDAISLFASSTALLMFLSILTARFAEEDFLVSLPQRLIIGLWTLMLSTTSMMVAFGATLFIVFGHGKPWMLGPICVFAFLPIASFSTIQIPLIVDLFWSTYRQNFGKQSNNKKNRFNLNDIRLFFGK